MQPPAKRDDEPAWVLAPGWRCCSWRCEARARSKDSVDPNYPGSAEMIGIEFARSMKIEVTDQAALARLRALSSEEVLRGAPAQPGVRAPAHETTPVVEGKLITKTAKTAYKANRQTCIPIMVGSNSADTAGDRMRATTTEQFFARFGQWNTQAKAAYDPDGTTDLATMAIAANALVDNGSPACRYRFSYVQAVTRERMRAGSPHGDEIGFVFGTLTARPGGPSSPEDQAVSRMAQGYWVNFAKTGDPNGAGLPAWPRHDSRKDSIFDFRPDDSAGTNPDTRKARLDVMQLATDSWEHAFPCRERRTGIRLDHDSPWSGSQDEASLLGDRHGITTTGSPDPNDTVSLSCAPASIQRAPGSERSSTMIMSI